MPTFYLSICIFLISIRRNRLENYVQERRKRVDQVKKYQVGQDGHIGMYVERMDREVEQ